MIQRMLANLLDNAIKYTPSGGAVTVSVSENDGTGRCLRQRYGHRHFSGATFPAFLSDSTGAIRAGQNPASVWA